MMFRAQFVLGAALAVLPVAAAQAASDFGEPSRMGAGEVLIQYEKTKPTDAQVGVCEKLGGEVTQLADGTYVCVRRST